MCKKEAQLSLICERTFTKNYFDSSANTTDVFVETLFLRIVINQGLFLEYLLLNQYNKFYDNSAVCIFDIQHYYEKHSNKNGIK